MVIKAKSSILCIKFLPILKAWWAKSRLMKETIFRPYIIEEKNNLHQKYYIYDLLLETWTELISRNSSQAMQWS